MFRMPWWLREYIKKKIPIDPKNAQQKKLYLSIAYAITAFMAFNLSVMNYKTPGVTKEEEKSLSTGEKAMLTINAPMTKYVKYRIGEGVVSESTFRAQDLKESIEHQRSNSQMLTESETLE